VNLFEGPRNDFSPEWGKDLEEAGVGKKKRNFIFLAHLPTFIFL
jgi:hypothetical protein